MFWRLLSIVILVVLSLTGPALADGGHVISRGGGFTFFFGDGSSAFAGGGFTTPGFSHGFTTPGFSHGFTRPGFGRRFSDIGVPPLSARHLFRSHRKTIIIDPSGHNVIVVPPGARVVIIPHDRLGR